MSLSSGKKRFYDLALIGGLLLLSLLSYVLLAGGREGGSCAVICVKGEEVQRIPLDRQGRYELNGGSNILIIQDGSAWLEDANCPDKLCVRQGRISLDGQVITCLPNKLTVTVYGDNSEVELIS